MVNRIKKFVRRNKGLEALQAVLIVGIAFMILLGVKSVWGKSKPEWEQNFNTILKSDSGTGGAGGAGGGGAGG